MNVSKQHDVVYRSCNLCEAHCGVAVTVDAQENRVLDIRGDDNDALSQGYICPKATGLRALSEDPDRLRAPVKRVDGKFVEISWDEAFELVVSRLQDIRDTSGPNAIATYLGNPNAHDFQSTLSIPALVRAIGTRWRFSATSVDQLPKHVSSTLLFGGMMTIPIPDVDRTQFLLVLGANPLASNGSLMTAPDMRGRLRRLRERGGTLVVVDPRRSETARIADRHLSIRPGTDALFLFSLVHVLFDEDRVDLGSAGEFTNGLEAMRDLAREFSPESVSETTGIEPESVREVARAFADAPAAACYGRIGTCTQEFGTLASWLVDVLNILTGNLDREGGVMFPWPAHAPANPSPRSPGYWPSARWASRVRSLPEFGGELPVATLAEEIDTPGEGRVRALLTVAGNPVCSTPNAGRLDRALEKLDFMVSVDLYINETTRHADVILPTSAPLERENYDMVFHGFSVRNHAKWSPQALSPPAGVKHVWEIAFELAGRLNGATAEAVESLLAEGLLKSTVGPEKECASVDADTARELNARWRGPERLLDAMLRAGHYGDHYEDRPEGLSLETLKEAPHGIDLGPLRPRLPELLGTLSGKVELVSDVVLEDIERLRRVLNRPRPELVLVGRRHMRSNNSWMHNVPNLAKGPRRCTLVIHPEDAQKRGITEGTTVRVRSRVGEVEAPVEISPDIRPGVVSLPHGFGHHSEGTRLSVARAMQPGVNSNRLTDETDLDILSGNAILNGIPVEIDPGPVVPEPNP